MLFCSVECIKQLWLCLTRDFSRSVSCVGYRRVLDRFIKRCTGGKCVAMSTTHCSGSQWRVSSCCGPSQCAHASGSIVTINDALVTILSWSTYFICMSFCFVLSERLYSHIQYRVCYPLEKTSGEWRFLYDRAARPASIEIYIASRPLDGSAGTASLRPNYQLRGS